MQVKQLLASIREKTSLTDEEYAEMEELFGKFVLLNLLDQLDKDLSLEQKEDLMVQTQGVIDNNAGVAGAEKISGVFQQFGIDRQKIEEMMGLAQEFAFKKITESLASA